MKSQTTTESYEVREAREKAEQKKNILQAIEQIQAVSKLLGLVVQEPEEVPTYSVNLTATGKEVSLRFSVGGYRNEAFARLEVSGSYPEDLDGSYCRPTGYNEPAADTITVSTSKTAEQIAADITRRLLPRVKELTARIHAKNEETRIYRQTVGSAFKRVTGLNATPETAKTGRVRLDAIFKAAGGDSIGIYGDVQVFEETATIEAHNIPLDKAAAIIKILKGA